MCLVSERLAERLWMLKIPPKLVELVANVHGEPLSESINNSLSSKILTDALKIATIS